MHVPTYVQVLDNLNKKFLDAAKGSFSDYLQVYYFMTGMRCVGVRVVVVWVWLDVWVGYV